MIDARLATVLAACLVGAASTAALSEANERGWLGETEIDLRRRGACRAAATGLESDRGSVAPLQLMGTSRLWFSLHDTAPTMPLCARGPAPFTHPELPEATVSATVGIHDISVLDAEHEALDSEILVLELEMLVAAELLPTLTTRRQDRLGQLRAAFENALNPDRRPWVQHYTLRGCDDCLSVAWATRRRAHMQENMWDGAKLRPSLDALIEHRSGGARHTVILILPRTSAYETAMAPVLDPWRESLSQRALGDPHLHVWTFPAHSLEEADFFDSAHFGPTGVEKFRAWIQERLLELVRASAGGMPP